jgi:transcriptional regulator with GAF, ATPase, and Fis domain
MDDDHPRPIAGAHDRGAAGWGGAEDVLTTVADATESLTAAIAAFSDVDTTLGQLCRDLVGAVPGADAAGVTVIRRGRPRTTSFTDDVVLDVDAAQYATGQGPCLEATTTRMMVRADSTVAAEMFPAFWSSNVGTGMHSFLSAPVAVDDDHHGALNLYSRDDHGFSSLDEAALRIYVTVTGNVLAAAQQVIDAQNVVQGFTKAMESRAAIEQCKGILMAVLDITDAKAIDLIKWRSQETNVPVRRLCEQILRDVAATPFGDEASRAALGSILMTAHTRVATT